MMKNAQHDRIVLDDRVHVAFRNELLVAGHRRQIHGVDCGRMWPDHRDPQSLHHGHDDDE